MKEMTVTATGTSVPEAASGPRTIRVLALMEATSLTGPAKNLIQFACAARSSGQDLPCVHLSVVAFVRGNQETNGFIDAVRSAGIELDVVHERHAFDLGVIGQLRRVVAGRQPDIIQTHNIKSHFLTRVAKLNVERRWIAFLHGYTSTDLKMLAYNQLDRWTLRGADQIVTVCGEFKKQLHGRGIPSERITVRHNMVQAFVAASEDAVTALRRELGISPQTAVLFTAGRLSREKGHLDLIEAAVRLSEFSTMPFRVIVAGEGPERGALERHIRELELGGTVMLVGHKKDLRLYYSLADIVVLPSHSEGSPNVLLETMAAGLPCVATAVGGVPEIATDGTNALLVPKGDTVAIAKAMARLLEDGALRVHLGTAARTEAQKYDRESYCREMVGLYESMLDDKCARSAR